MKTMNHKGTMQNQWKSMMKTGWKIKSSKLNKNF